MTLYIYNASGQAVGFQNGKYIHNMHGRAIGQINKETHVHKLSGEYVGELDHDMGGKPPILRTLFLRVWVSQKVMLTDEK